MSRTHKKKNKQQQRTSPKPTKAQIAEVGLCLWDLDADCLYLLCAYYLNAYALGCLGMVNKRLRHATTSDKLWQHHLTRLFGDQWKLKAPPQFKQLVAQAEASRSSSQSWLTSWFSWAFNYFSRPPVCPSRDLCGQLVGKLCEFRLRCDSSIANKQGILLTPFCQNERRRLGHVKTTAGL